MGWMTMALCFSGWLCLCLAMPKHYKQVWRHERPALRQVLKGWGVVSLCLSFVASVRSSGWSFGPVEWVGMLAATGLTLVFLLPYAPRWAAVGGLVALLAACVIPFV